MNFELVVIPPELSLDGVEIVNLDDHIRLVGITCWKPKDVMSKWPWGIGGACDCNKEK